MKRICIAFFLAILMHLLCFGFGTLIVRSKEKTRAPHTDLITLQVQVIHTTKQTKSEKQEAAAPTDIPAVTPDSHREEQPSHQIIPKKIVRIRNTRKKTIKPPATSIPHLQNSTTQSLSAKQSAPKSIPQESQSNLNQKSSSEKDTEESTSQAAERSVIEAVPILHLNRAPTYPAIARKRGYEGVVLLMVFVKRDGSVGDLNISRSSGFKLLDRAALTSVKYWHFTPGRRGETPISMWVTVPVRFTLQ